jgi:hypothetical protein
LTLEGYLKSSMLLDNLDSISLSPVTASSEPGNNFTSTSIRFAGSASFAVELPTSSVLIATQEAALASTSNMQSAINDNPNLIGVRVVQVSFEELDAATLVDGGIEQNSGNSGGGKNNAAIVAPIVLIFSLLVAAGGYWLIRRRRRSVVNHPDVTSSPSNIYSTIKSLHLPPSQFPDIEKPKASNKESVNTPNEDDESEGDADLSSYMMTASTSSQMGVLKTTIEERPEEISVSHIGEASEDGYLSTDDESARFGATDMSECTFKG